MGLSDDLCFDVYVRTRTAVITLVREVSLRAALVVAHHHADTRGQPAFIRNRKTNDVETIGPSVLGATRWNLPSRT